MARKRYNDEDILRLLREIEVHLHGTNLGGKVSSTSSGALSKSVLPRLIETTGGSQ